MFKPAFDTPFVCLDDIYKGYVELNPVVWNPSLTVQENEKIVREILKKYFCIEIDDVQLHQLVSVTSAAEFVKEFISLL
jgi:hypothetical protein